MLIPKLNNHILLSRKKVRIIGFKILLLMLCSCNSLAVSDASTVAIDAKSCSASDVQAAIDSANNGDIVRVPPGRCIWSGGGVDIPRTKGVTIMGAGIDQTVITDATGPGWEDLVFLLNGGEDNFYRISGFTINGASDWNGAISVRGTCKSWRIDHIKFEDLGLRSLTVGGDTYGVIDNCSFVGDLRGTISVKHVNNGNTIRLAPPKFGTADAVYVEDCIFNQNTILNSESCIDAQAGGHFVFRHNTCDPGFLVVHGSDSGCPERGVYWYEIYENAFNFDGTEWYTAMLFRGGTGVIYNNTFTGNYQQAIRLDNYRSHLNYDGPCVITMERCDGNSAYDGNQESNGYPCLDMIGRGNEDSNPPPWGSQASVPLYEWGNTFNGVDADCYVVPTAQHHILENRDFYNDTRRPGYRAFKYPHPLRLPDAPSNLRIEKVGH